MNGTITGNGPAISVEITRGLASLVLNELPLSLTERGLADRTDLTDRVRALALGVCSTYSLDYTETGPTIIDHVLGHLTGYLPGLEVPQPHHLLPDQPFCDRASAWIVNRLGAACEQFPEVVVPLLRRAADDYQPAEECNA